MLELFVSKSLLGATLKVAENFWRKPLHLETGRGSIPGSYPMGKWSFIAKIERVPIS